jgi:hypothetical protein
MQDEGLFKRDDALVRLGVGKNMVDAIQFWSTAREIIKPTMKGHSLNPIGDSLLGDSGWDPYLETPAALWVLQWLLTRRPDRASTWHYAFTRWNRAIFTRDELVGWLHAVARQAGTSRASRASLRRDADVFLRTYVPHHERGRRPIEDSFDCPLSELGLITELERGLYAFSRGYQPTLHPHVLAYAVLDYWGLYAESQDTLSFERLLHGPGGPGGAFQLSEMALVGLLEQLPRDIGLIYDESAGMRRVVRDSSKRIKASLDVLNGAFPPARKR